MVISISNSAGRSKPFTCRFSWGSFATWVWLTGHSIVVLRCNMWGIYTWRRFATVVKGILAGTPCLIWMSCWSSLIWTNEISVNLMLQKPSNISVQFTVTLWLHPTSQVKIPKATRELHSLRRRKCKRITATNNLLKSQRKKSEIVPVDSPNGGRPMGKYNISPSGARKNTQPLEWLATRPGIPWVRLRPGSLCFLHCWKNGTWEHLQTTDQNVPRFGPPRSLVANSPALCLLSQQHPPGCSRLGGCCIEKPHHRGIPRYQWVSHCTTHFIPSYKGLYHAISIAICQLHGSSRYGWLMRSAASKRVHQRSEIFHHISTIL